MNWASLGTRLAQLGGADPQLLPKVPAAKGRFLQMGLVLVSTAGLAVVSMSFALVDGLKAHWLIAVALGLCWGFVILNLDRMLIQNMRSGSTVWRTIAMVIPRIVVAALLGLVIATPLVVRIFEAEIVAEMTEHNAENAIVLGNKRADSPQAKRLAVVNEEIKTNEGILAGNVPGLTSPNIQAATTQLTTAQTNLAAKRTVAQDAYDAMICELDGHRCRDSSGKSGPGQRYKALKRLYETAARDLSTAEQAVDTAQAAMDKANAEAAESNDTTLADAQQRANSALPALYQERDKLQTAINGIVAGDSTVVSANTGMLARIEALDRIGAQSGAARRAHLAVAALLFMIELLPVLVKLLTNLGPPSLYDRISEMEDNSTFDDATRRRHDDRRRIEGESKTRREIEDDMRAREKKLALRGNEHVAREMETILNVALADWSKKVVNTLATSPNGAPRHNGGVPNQPSARPADAKARATFNLPPGGTL